MRKVISGFACPRRLDTDAELDDAERSGIADQDGLDEQVPFRELAKRRDGVMKIEQWHRRHAIMLTGQLPDGSDDFLQS